MTDTSAGSQASKLVFADKPKWSLVALGGLLVLLFAVGIVFSRWVGSETTETSPPTTSGQTATVTKTTKSKAVPSDSVLTAILASGTALILVGVLYYRISSVKLPGGAEVGLTAKEEKKATNTVKKKVKDETKAVAAKKAALQRIRQEKETLGVLEFESETVERLAEEAVKPWTG